MPQNKKQSLVSQSNQQSIVGLLGFNDMPLDAELRALRGIGPWIHSEFLLRVVQSLSPAHIEQFVALVEQDEKNEEALLDFLKQAVPRIDDLLEESVMAVRGNLIAQKNYVHASL